MVVKKKLLNIILKTEKFKKKEKNKYKNLSGEEKESKRKYGKNRYRNMKENAS